MSVRLTTTLRPFIRLTRPPYLLLEGCVSALLLVTFQKGLGDPVLVGTAVLAVLLVGTGGATINDYFDRESDMVTHLERPIPSGEISPTRTAQFATATFIAGLGLSLVINALAFGIMALNVVLFTVYPRFVKRISGFVSNLLMGYLGAALALFAGAAVFNAINVAVLSFVGMIAAALIAFNVLKDILTVRGDVKIGYNTIAARHGIRVAATVGSVFVFLTGITTPLPYFAGVVDVAYLFPMTVAVCVMLFASFSLLRVPDTRNVQRQIKTFLACWAVFPVALLASILL